MNRRGMEEAATKFKLRISFCCGHRSSKFKLIQPLEITQEAAQAGAKVLLIISQLRKVLKSKVSLTIAYQEDKLAEITGEDSRGTPVVRSLARDLNARLTLLSNFGSRRPSQDLSLLGGRSNQLWGAIIRTPIAHDACLCATSKRSLRFLCELSSCCAAHWACLAFGGRTKGPQLERTSGPVLVLCHFRALVCARGAYGALLV